MEPNTHKGQPVADLGKLIRLTLRGHYVRWRLDSALAATRTPGPGPSALARESTERSVRRRQLDH